MPSSQENLAERIAREHAALGRAMREVKSEIVRLRSGPAGDQRAGVVFGMLSMFAHHLHSHFALEEQDGFIGDTVSGDAGTSRQVDALLAEHRALENELAALVDSAARANAAGGGFSESFVDALDRFMAHLKAHEHAENEVVQEFLVRDQAAAD